MKIVKYKYNDTYPIKLPQQRVDLLEHNRAYGWEKARIDAMHKTIKKDDVVLYVGAEQGDIPTLCALWGAKVVLVEASDLMWGNVKTIFDANDVKPIEIYKGFASNKTAPVSNIKDRQNAFDKLEAGWIDNPGFYELHTSTGVPQTKIDDLIATGTPPPNVICMDIEGSEGEALKGAEQTILKYKPVIYLSLHPEFLFNYYGVYSRNLRDWIRDRGYKETLLDYQHEVHLLYEPI